MITQIHTPLDPTTIARKLDQATAATVKTYLTLLQSYEDTLRLITRLKTEGITNATPYYRDNLYLYLIHPTASDGSRKREYIGADPDKQTDALNRINRFMQHHDAVQKANHEITILTKIYQTLQSLSGGSRENL